MALRSDLRTPPLCPLVDLHSTANGGKGSSAMVSARRAGRLVRAGAGQVPRIWLRQWNSEKFEASAQCAQEIKRWRRKTLTFAAASAPAFVRARGLTP